ncbi:hypothetical protein BKA66DRAFT_497827, partial [Pyrenochaeta sp. MPI-SDFR-AT-0127]
MSLVSVRKRKDFHNPLFVPRNKGKIRVVERPTETPASTSVKPLHARAGLPGSRTFDNLRRGSIRIFSILRNGKSSAPNSGQPPSGSNGSVRNSSDSTQRAAPEETHGKPPLQHTGIPSALATSPDLTLNHHSSSVLQLTNATGFDGESEPILSITNPHPPALHASRSTPGLSRQLTTKISSAFQNNDTVIHRPKLISRPTVQAADLEQHAEDHRATALPQPPISDVPSLPSSFLGSSNAPPSQSTAPTSLVSSGAPISAETTHRAQQGFRRASTRGSPPQLCEPTTEPIPLQFLVFPRQDAPRQSQPSIATIEKAAAAKVFFESHFNQLLGTSISPRSLRRRRMERKIFPMALTNEQRHQKRRE